MNDAFEETTIPYPEIIQILQENEYEGYLLSEYEGADKYDEGYEVGQTLRKQHIMLKNCWEIKEDIVLWKNRSFNPLDSEI